jgi:hypothetical protein
MIETVHEERSISIEERRISIEKGKRLQMGNTREINDEETSHWSNKLLAVVN